MSSRNGHENINGHPHRQVCHVIGKDSGGVGNPNTESAALGHVNVVGADAGGDDEAEGRQRSEDVAGDFLHGVAENGANGRLMDVEG